ncbi:hypothetical protein [Hymenobacter qilianensis]|uniref:Tyr recombinase domain-containing protein n=1 Tax=Hymenobacter qilianensis TaxID=1385715 RepID=A0A7H0GT55_9BACT|nr:hypothetical protein [Hymenobacter qilianensis]QNP51471.1 hypothetical protein H9L05_15790 [Hymenobacter qilianensis]
MEEGLIVNLAKSKTNQYSAVEEKAILYSPDFKMCPIRTLQIWVQRLDRTSGPVFVSFRKGERLTERRLTDKHLNLIVQRYMGQKYSAHSLRVSFVMVAKLAGLMIRK